MADKKNIDVTEISNSIDRELKEGLRTGKFTIDDIERVLSQGINKIKEKIISDVEEIIPNEIMKDKTDVCPKCKKPLKKTKK